jgi:hypothetical protein
MLLVAGCFVSVFAFGFLFGLGFQLAKKVIKA